MAHHRALLRLFAASCACGFLLGLLWGGPTAPLPPPPPPPPLRPAGDLAALYPAWLRRQGLSRAQLPSEHSNALSEAGYLAAHVSILCALQQDEAPRGAVAARRTWLRRCSASVEYGRHADHSLTGPAPPAPARLRALLRKLHSRLATGGFQWILLAGDSSFVVLENLRRLLAPLSASEPHYLGQPAVVGGRLLNLAAAGVLLSAGAVRRLDRAERDGRFDELHPGLTEEAALGHMMSALSIAPGDTRDGLGRPRFLPLPPSALHQASARHRFSAFWRHSVYLLTEETVCCSPEVVTFGRVAWSRIYLLEYMVHHVATSGRDEGRSATAEGSPLSQPQHHSRSTAPARSRPVGHS